MKFKQTINVKKFISILLCTIFISSILPSNLLNCTVFAGNAQPADIVYEGSDIEYQRKSLGYKFSKIVNENDNTTLTKGTDYTIIESTDDKSNPIWKFTFTKTYLDGLPKGKNYCLRIYYTVDENYPELTDLPTKEPYTICIPESTEIPVPMLLTPKRIGIASDVNDCKLYLSNAEQNGVKEISAKGMPGCTIKIINKEDSKEIGSGIVPNECECKISLNDEFNKLENGKEYSLSIYQEDNSSKEKSDSFDVKLYIRNTYPTITLTLDGKPFSDDKKISFHQLDCVIATAEDQEGKKLNPIYLISTTKLDDEALKAATNWRNYTKEFAIAMKATQKSNSVYLYFKAIDIANYSTMRCLNVVQCVGV